MHIKELKLTNFKSFKNLKFECNKNFNVIIGENNIGKSTIFEAILLWQHCFNKIINSKKTGFYKADGGNTYIPFSELNFIRLINDTDLFYEAPNQARITIIIKKDNNEFNLAFEISKPKSISNSYLRFKTISHREFLKFAEFTKGLGIKLDNIFFIYQTKPVSNILSKEPFMNKGQVLKKISLGKSGEVLRNKIIQKPPEERKRLAKQISKILGTNIEINYLNEKKSKIDEYINLKIKSNHKNLDIHLQGSGFLQVAEIFSTIGYLENAINILLIDEPDSHIHAKLQKKLLQELRSLSKTQTFIISHNDNFVSELSPGELYYLNNEAKQTGVIPKLEIENFDQIKKELGGIIVALDKLNSTDKICFVEGDDDIKYIKKLLQKHLSISNTKPTKNVVFYYLRGKDYLLNKLDFNKRLLSQLFKDKQYCVIYDKDFSTELATADFDNKIKRKLGNTSFVWHHQGYCIESTLFSDLEKLCKFLSSQFSQKSIRVYYFITEFMDKIKNDFSSHLSDIYKDFEKKFNSQKTDARPELNGIEFNTFLADAIGNENNKFEYLFNKHLIKEFLNQFFIHFNISYNFEDDSVDNYSSTIFELYIDSIKTLDDFIPNNHNLLMELYELN